MPHIQTVTLSLPTYGEVREKAMAEYIDSTPSWKWPSVAGLQLVAAFQQAGCESEGWYERRANLLAARAKFSIARHMSKIYLAEGIDPNKRRTA